MNTPFLTRSSLQRTSSAGSGLRRLSSAKMSRVQSGVTIEHHNLGLIPKAQLYYQDLYHTLVNMPAHRFFALFLMLYCSLYVVFAALYFSQPEECISNTHTFLHCLWFSVHTSATIGYGHMAPDPNCSLLQSFILVEVLTGLLLQAILLGVVYARFSTPQQRAHTIRFSKMMTLYQGADGFNRLCFRVANIRKHQVLRPELRMLLLRRQKQGGGLDEWVYSDLPVCHAGGGGRLWLGVPTVLKHVVDEQSPLFGMELEQMERLGWEIIILLDGYDESTSQPVQARQSYMASDIAWEARFEPMIRRAPSGFLGVDFRSFDLTAEAAAEGGSSEEGEGDAAERGAAAALGPAGDGGGKAGGGAGETLARSGGGAALLGVLGRSDSLVLARSAQEARSMAASLP